MVSSTSNPANPIKAVTHADPYPYYARLLQERPFYRDAALGCWVASSSAVVREVLTSPFATVRPSAEPVPRHLLNTPVAEIFARLIRQNDGNIHQTLKPAVTRTLTSVGMIQTAQLTRQAAQFLLKNIGPQTHPGDLTDFAFRLPIFVMAGLLGIAEDQLFQISDSIKDLVKSLAVTTKDVPQVEQGKAAAVFLLETLNTLLTADTLEMFDPGANLVFHRFIQEAKSVGCSDRSVAMANVIGFLSQTYDATAGLIGNSLVTLATNPEIYRHIKNDSRLLKNLVQEVIRYDPPIHNTRRFISAPTIIAGQELKEGETVLVLLAAANRDSSTNSEPARFDLWRNNRQIYSFGMGKHSCPGHHLAGLIAEVALETLLLEGRIPEDLTGPVEYLPSENARIPIL